MIEVEKNDKYVAIAFLLFDSLYMTKIIKNYSFPQSATSQNIPSAVYLVSGHPSQGL